MFDRLKKLDLGLRKTRDAWFGRVQDLFDRPAIDAELWDELEEILLGADVGVEATQAILKRLQTRVREERLRDPTAVRDALKDEIAAIVTAPERGPEAVPSPRIVLVIGVNGVGKTTTIGKLAKQWRDRGDRVVIGAADTFRAAAIDQIKAWGARIGVEVVAHQPGGDPGAVVFDTLEAGRARAADVIVIDTAGRLHTKTHLMEELAKLRRIIQRFDATAPHEVLLVLDATTGQNGLNQARAFFEQAGATGIVLAKLDGTSRGGIVLPIVRELGLPIRYVGTGEGPDDLAPFDPQEYAEALFLRAA